MGFPQILSTPELAREWGDGDASRGLVAFNERLAPASPRRGHTAPHIMRAPARVRLLHMVFVVQ